MEHSTKLVRPDWSKEIIKGKLREKGYSLAELCRIHGKGKTYFTVTLIQPMRFGEKVIADILGVEPSEIWPSRYGDDGLPNQGRFLPDRDKTARGSSRGAS